jgi:hypothetical protein
MENKRSFLEVSGDIVERVHPISFSDPMTVAMKAIGMTYASKKHSSPVPSASGQGRSDCPEQNTIAPSLGDYIDRVGKSWQNGVTESFDECFGLEWFSSRASSAKLSSF